MLIYVILLSSDCFKVQGHLVPRLYMIHIDKIYVEIVTHHFSHICTRVMSLDLLQNFVSAQYLEIKGQILTKLYLTIYTDKIYVGIVSCHFSQICQRDMAID